MKSVLGPGRVFPGLSIAYHPTDSGGCGDCLVGFRVLVRIKEGNCVTASGY